MTRGQYGGQVVLCLVLYAFEFRSSLAGNPFPHEHVLSHGFSKIFRPEPPPTHIIFNDSNYFLRKNITAVPAFHATCSSRYPGLRYRRTFHTHTHVRYVYLHNGGGGQQQQQHGYKSHRTRVIIIIDVDARNKHVYAIVFIEFLVVPAWENGCVVGRAVSKIKDIILSHPVCVYTIPRYERDKEHVLRLRRVLGPIITPAERASAG